MWFDAVIPRGTGPGGTLLPIPEFRILNRSGVGRLDANSSLGTALEWNL